MNIRPTTTLALLCTLSYAPGAMAYLDPGTGSMILQMLIAGVLGALYTIKMYWFRIKAFVSRMTGKTPAEEDIGAEANTTEEGSAGP